VGPDELSGVTSIKEEAFEACKNIAQVDLSKTTVNTIPEACFKDMELNSITLPSTLKVIESEAFQDRGSKRMVVYFKSDPIRIEEDAFDNAIAGDPDVVGDGRNDSKQNLVIFQCQEGSNADFYATVYPYINSSNDEVYQEWTVIFYNLPDYPLMTNQVMLDKQTVRSGEDAVPPPDPTCNDPELQFTGWSQYTNIQKNTDVYAIYRSPEYTVTFLDGYTGETLKTETVKHGQSATPPEAPSHDDKKQMFVGWDKPSHNITADTTIIARYADSSGDISKHKVNFYLTDADEEPWWPAFAADGEVLMEPMPPSREGYTFVKWMWIPASSATGVKQDTSVYAQWTIESSGNNPSASPGNNPSTSPGNNPSTSPGNNPSTSPGNNPSDSRGYSSWLVEPCTSPRGGG
ncbi:MAG: leucine-rich repeat protein, partial [Lachnospiraceae bacterium]|nr:leucine-rich repeat protein [Lachnospiraceae bacterium]